jgi:cellulose synthase (UDP-forming)
LRGAGFSSYRIGSDIYHVGSLSWWIWLTILFQDYQWLMVICTVFACFLIAILIRSILRRKARARLQGNG